MVLHSQARSTPEDHDSDFNLSFVELYCIKTNPCRNEGFPRGNKYFVRNIQVKQSFQQKKALIKANVANHTTKWLTKYLSEYFYSLIGLVL